MPWNVRQHSPCVDVNGVATGRLDDRHAVVGDMTAEIARGGDAVFEIIRIEHFFEPHGDRFQIAPRKTAVGGKPFGENQQIALLLRPDGRRWCTAFRRYWRTRLSWRKTCSRPRRKTSPARSVSGSTGEIRALACCTNQAFSAKRQASRYNGMECRAATSRTARDVRHRHRLPAAGVVRDGQHHQRNFLRAFGGDQLFERRDVHVAFERNTRLGIRGRGKRKIDGPGSRELDIRAGRIEVCVAWNNRGQACTSR